MYIYIYVYIYIFIYIYIYIYISTLNFEYLDMKMSNKNLFKKALRGTFLRLYEPRVLLRQQN